MTILIIITICSLLLIAYIFDITASKTKIPSVIMLLLLGWVAKEVSSVFAFNVPELSTLLPIFGTVGLILIVLEGSLELDLDKSKLSLVKKSFIVASVPMFISIFLIGFVIQYLGQFSLKDSLINAVPLCIISSAIAIPTVSNLSKKNKEFIIYESSLSDIIGVLFFNFIALNEEIAIHSFGYFLLELLVICVVSFIATIGLSYLLKKIDHHIKYAPIVILVILIYSISKIYHLPALIFILLFGLFLGNLDKLKHIRWIKKLEPEELDKQIHKFTELIIEGAFLIRALFFILFGYLMKTSEIINTDTLGLALGIVCTIFILRFLVLKLSSLPIMPLLFIAPRGLITILLFFGIPAAQVIPIVNKSLVIQVIIMTAFIMMIGIMINKSDNKPMHIKEE